MHPWSASSSSRTAGTLLPALPPSRRRWQATRSGSRRPAAPPTAGSARTARSSRRRSPRPTRATGRSCSAASAVGASPPATSPTATRPTAPRGSAGALVEAGIAAADQGDGAIVLGDLGSAILTARHVLDGHTANGAVRLLHAPPGEGAGAAAVVSSAGRPVDEVASAAEEARAIPKL